MLGCLWGLQGCSKIAYQKMYLRALFEKSAHSGRAALRNLAPQAHKKIAAPVVESILPRRAAMANPRPFQSLKHILEENRLNPSLNHSIISITSFQKIWPQSRFGLAPQLHYMKVFFLIFTKVFKKPSEDVEFLKKMKNIQC